MENSAKKTLFIVPTYNEEGRIGKVIDEIKGHMPFSSVAVINDCSSDNSENEGVSHGAIVINHPYNMGYSCALLTGLEYALSNGFEYVIFFDGDGQHIAAESKHLFDQLFLDASDMVIGSRFLKPTDYHHGLFKTMGTMLFSALVKLFTRKQITDPTSGFLLLGKRSMGAYLKSAAYLDYPDANLIITLLKKGIKISEVPVKMRTREDGESMHGGIWRPMRYMVLVIYSVFLAALSTKEG